MSIFFEEEVEDVPNHVKEMCRDIFKKHGFLNCEVTTEPACKKGENYCSKLLRLTANDGVKCFSVIMKMGLIQEYLRASMFTRLLFHNESIIYSEMLPKFDELQHYIGLPVEEWFGHAKCYGLTDKPIEVILLEDLKQSDFSNAENYIIYNNDEILISLNEMAKFHALSFVLKVQDEDFFNDIKMKLIDIWTTDYNMTAFNGFYGNVAGGTAVYFDKEKEKKYLYESIFEITDLLKSFRLDDNIKSKYLIITHGAMWKNKIMFMYKDNIPVRVKILGYQFSNVGRVSMDLLILLFNATTHDSRMKHYRQWIDHYYACFDEFLNKFNIASEDVYPREVFESDLKRDAKLCFGLAVLYASFFAREEELYIKYNKLDISDKPAQRYREKVESLMKTISELGFMT